MQTLSQQALWNRYCTYYREFKEVGLSIDISRMGFSDSFFKEMEPAIQNAFSQMTALEKGAIANPDEKRMVGHYWLRNATLAPSADLTKTIESECAKVKQFALDIRSGNIRTEKGGSFSHVLLIGIGGSALGPQLVADALASPREPMQITFLDNTDPDGIQRILERIGDNLKNTLSIVISKSGGTPETRNGQLEVALAYKNKGLSFAKHAIAVTCEGSKLDSQSKADGWLPSIYMWDWVGGRTSLFSAVGLLPAALQGIDIDAFLAGAKKMDEITRVPNTLDNPASILALMWHHAGKGKGLKDMVVLPYKDRLVLFSKYLQQLVMESIGKEKDLQGAVVHQGIAVYGNKGSTDQHAYIQQLREGINNFFATFISVEKDPTADSNEALQVEPGITSGDFLFGFLQGTRQALYENGRESISLSVQTLTPFSLGSLIALYERAVGLYASLVNINAYHQPGVEAGKKAASDVLSLQKEVSALLKAEKAPLSANQVADKLGKPEKVEAVYLLLMHLSSSNSSIQRKGGLKPEERQFFFA